ncbi:hypothetical protein [Methanocalculus sp.]|uniref:hypothetical protein n=1 Tax=Methanocalculus sp. TaxID=2004547 RepID=UPI002717E34B|nr:hypothetical protein [Methanocalculus sp.]MDO8841924.1 hypothetical protein [Methanocalculus sp.]
MKTMRDVAGRWTRIQQRKAPSITASIEAAVKAEIISEYGSVLGDSARRDIERKEYARRRSSTRIVNESRRKILAQKEKAEIIIDIRKRRHTGIASSKTAPPPAKAKKEESPYEELEFEY